MKRKFALPIIVLAALTCACSPQITKLTSVDKPDYYNGREIVTKEDDDTRISVEIDSYTGDEIVFYVEVENKSNAKMFVRPGDFYIDAVEKDLQTIDELYPRYYAINPENQIENINEDMAQRKTAHAFATGVNAILGFASIVSDLSSDKDAKVIRVAEDIGIWADNQVREEIDYDADLRNYDSQKEFWKTEVLRVTDLNQKDIIGGLVFVPIDTEIKYLRLTVPLYSGDYNFLYYKEIMN